MFTDSPFEIEASDLDALVRAGDVIKLPDGRVALPVLLVLRDEAGKTFGTDASADFPTAMHLAAGASVRRMVFEHLGAAVIEAHVAPAAEAAPEAPTESAAESTAALDAAGAAADASAEAASDATESAASAAGAEDQTDVEPVDDTAASEPAADETAAPAEREATPEA